MIHVVDRIRGVVFGQAIGDALGLGTEYLSRSEIRHVYPRGLRSYDQFLRDFHRSTWHPGEWTDDTNQMLCILECLLSRGCADVNDIAARFVEWANSDGRGLGGTVARVIREPRFLELPHEASRRIWEQSGQTLAANGGVMRTSILGVWEYHDPLRVMENAESVCKITHWDPRCVGSSVAVSLAIASLLRGECDLDNIVADTSQAAEEYHPEVRECLRTIATHSLESLSLDRIEGVGYTIRTLGAGFWALCNGITFESGLLSIINEGGDADTNGAVAGSLLGARFGYSSIPTPWIAGLAAREKLEALVDRLVSGMGIACPPTSGGHVHDR
jgi:ADP-ribosylglycohydrolase